MPLAALRTHAPLGACAILLALVWTAVAVIDRQSWRLTEREGELLRENLANSLAEYEASSVRAIDMTLVFLREAWRRDPKAFADAVQKQEELLTKERVISVGILDRDGWLAYSRNAPGARINFADRDYFIAQRDAGADRLGISEPLMGRVTRQWAIQFTRRLEAADGGFNGLVVVAVAPPALEGVYREIDLGPGGTITLVREDGTVLARSSDFRGGMRFPQLVPPAAHGAGRLDAVSPVDGVERSYAFRRIPDYGLVVLIGQERDTIAAAHAPQRAYLLAFGAAATVLIACIGLLVGLRRRDQARFESERERVMLELHDGCIQSIYAVGLNLQASRGSLPPEASRADAAIARAEADLNLVIQELRAFIGGEGPRERTPEQFRAEVERALPPAERTRFEVALQEDAIEALRPREADHVLRIVREAASNVARHAEAGRARIALRRARGELVLEVDDDGRGLAAQRTPGGLGLAHIQARARELRGVAEFAAGEAGGTRLIVRFPEPA